MSRLPPRPDCLPRRPAREKAPCSGNALQPPINAHPAPNDAHPRVLTVVNRVGDGDAGSSECPARDWSLCGRAGGSGGRRGRTHPLPCRGGSQREPTSCSECSVALSNGFTVERFLPVIRPSLCAQLACGQHRSCHLPRPLPQGHGQVLCRQEWQREWGAGMEWGSPWYGMGFTRFRGVFSTDRSCCCGARQTRVCPPTTAASLPPHCPSSPPHSHTTLSPWTLLARLPWQQWRVER